MLCVTYANWNTIRLGSKRSKFWSSFIIAGVIISELVAKNTPTFKWDFHCTFVCSAVLQLLDLMHTLHTRAAVIFKSWAAEEEQKQEQEEQPSAEVTDGAEEKESESEQTVDAGASTLWLKCWCPLLQGESSVYIHTGFIEAVFVNS